MMRHFLGMLVLALVTACTAQAEADVSGLYEVTTEGAKVKAGEKGAVVIAINAKPGAYVSEEAPLKIELSSAAAKLDKQKLTLADSVTKKKDPKDAKEHPNPRFEIAFTTAAKTTIEAKLVFFLCTEKVCARQTKQLSMPVDVN